MLKNGLADALDAVAVVVTAHRQNAGRAGLRHARQRFNVTEQLAVETGSRLWLRVFLIRQGDLHGEDVGRIDPEIRAQHFDEAANHQPRADQEHQRQGDVRNHKDVARAIVRGVTRRAFAALF